MNVAAPEYFPGNHFVARKGFAPVAGYLADDSTPQFSLVGDPAAPAEMMYERNRCAIHSFFKLEFPQPPIRNHQ
jgi:hypothetical protein